jgi:hypothetical protein
MTLRSPNNHLRLFAQQRRQDLLRICQRARLVLRNTEPPAIFTRCLPVSRPVSIGEEKLEVVGYAGYVIARGTVELECTNRATQTLHLPAQCGLPNVTGARPKFKKAINHTINETLMGVVHTQKPSISLYLLLQSFCALTTLSFDLTLRISPCSLINVSAALCPTRYAVACV